MPLIIDLKPGEKLILNGAVIENAGSNAKIRFLNDCAILRQKEILLDSDCMTPAARVYFALQCAYIFENQRPKHITVFREFLHGYAEACPSARGLCDAIEASVDAGQHYHALRQCRDLLKHESDLLESLQNDVRDHVVPSTSGS